MDSNIDSFLRYLATERGLSEAYQLSVAQTLASLNDRLKRVNLELIEVGTTELAEFLSERKSESLSASSLRLATVHLKIFFRWLLSKKMISMDPAEPLVSSKADRKLPSTLSPAVVEGWLESIPTDVLLGRRDKAILELFYSSGLRLAELCAARLEWMDFEEGFLRVTGKGNKTRMVRVGKKALAAITDYLNNERPKLVKRNTSSHIFIGIRGASLTPERIRQIEQRAIKTLRTELATA